MNSVSRNSKFITRLIRTAKILISIVAILVAGIFLAIMITFYLFLSSSEQNNISNKKNIYQTSGSSVAKDHIINQDSKSESKEEPEQDLSSQRIDRQKNFNQQYKFMKEIANLRKDSRLESASPLCDILCSESKWQNHTEGIELWDQFNSFLEIEGSRAFEDPKFRLVFETANSFADVMISVGDLMEQFEPILDKKSELSETEKIYWSAKAPVLITNMANRVTNLIPQLTPTRAERGPFPKVSYI